MVDIGRYATHLERFFTCFGRERFSIHLYEDFCTNPRAVCREILAFLGVRSQLSDRRFRAYECAAVATLATPAFGASLHSRSAWTVEMGATSVAQTSAPHVQRAAFEEVMSAADLRMLREHYGPEIKKTAELIGRDLSAWLR